MQGRDRCLKKHLNNLTCTPQACRETPEFYFILSCVTSRRHEGEDIECFSVSLFERVHPPSFQHRFAWLPFSRTLVCKGGQQLFVLSCTWEHEIRVFEPELRC